MFAEAIAETPTPETKPRDPRALNAYRHGLTGQVVILTPADQVAYHTHCKSIHDSLAPAAGMETDLVQSIADDRWRLKHAAGMENAIFAIGLGEPDTVTAHHEEIDAAFAHARVWLEQGKSLNLLTLYESRIQRRVEKNMAMLRQLQQDRQAALNQAVEEANLLAQLAESKGEIYDIERDFPREALPPQFDFSTTQIARLAIHSRRLADAKKHFQAPSKSFRRAA
jgi:hypothetical protein